MKIFNQIFTLKTANEIWLKLHEPHDDTVSAINPNWGFWWLNDKTNRDSNKFAPSMYTVILQTGEAQILW
jgi:GTP-dependent phosphoenolpyruvate carboxykinase